MPYTQLLENPARGGIQQRYLSYCGDWDYLALFYRFKLKKKITNFPHSAVTKNGYRRKAGILSERKCFVRVSIVYGRK